MVRSASIGKDGMKKGAWSAAEDEKLRNSVEVLQKYGHRWNWHELPKYAGLSRCGRSCRFRWMNYLRPNVKNGNYSKEEDDLILKLHQRLGNKWSEIAAKLPAGRSDNDVKNYWHGHLRKRLQEHEITFEAPKEQSKQKTNALAPKDVANSQPQAIFESSSLMSPMLSCGELASLIFELPKGHSVQMCSESAHLDVVNSLPQPFFESSLPSPAPSFGELPALLCDYAPSTDKVWIAEDGISSSELMFLEPAGNFWAENFVVDSSNIYNGFPYKSDEEGSMYPDPEYLQFDEFFYQTPQSLQSHELFYQALQDFLQN